MRGKGGGVGGNGGCFLEPYSGVMGGMLTVVGVLADWGAWRVP